MLVDVEVLVVVVALVVAFGAARETVARDSSTRKSRENFILGVVDGM